MKPFIILLAVCFLPISSLAQDFSGTYTSGQITLTLAKNVTGTYTGSLSGNNNVFKLTGQVQNGLLQGKVGEENSIAVVNLFAAARKNSYSGQGGGGNNFWSSRFGAGNSSADGSQGYVSVPGYGPVGYGF